MDLNLRDLRYFEIAAESGHLGQAAESISRSQPALTKAIRRLEQTIGGVLFEREGRGVRLTPVGEILLQQAKALRAAADESMRCVTDFANGNCGLVRIGSGAVTIDELLPDVCIKLLGQAQRVQVIIEVGASMDLLTRLRGGQLDLVVGLLPDINDPDLESQEIMRDEVVIAARAGHPIFKTRSATPASLLEWQWVLPSAAAPSRQWLDSVFASRGLPMPLVQIEANSLPLLPRIIAQTDLLSFIARQLIESTRSTHNLREIRLPGVAMQRRLGISYRRSGYLSPAAMQLVGLIQRHGAALFGGAALTA